MQLHCIRALYYKRIIYIYVLATSPKILMNDLGIITEFQRAKGDLCKKRISSINWPDAQVTSKYIIYI